MLAAALAGCETSVDLPSSDSDDDEVAAGGTSAADAAAFADVTWMNTTVDVTGWEQTATLNASVDSFITLDYDKAGEWPGVDGVNANCWVFFTHGGEKYASTFDWMRTGQTVKETGIEIEVDGGTWQPSSGETVGFMVTGLCRGSSRNVSERSNVDYVVWP